ncbi:hypothetical protein K438DRAFT_1875832 [Mycena galopus ATCC 62051]|nr:hypothetical protein K438DRAFT_1875832 [Mycena galopus ATCC 62051]
MNQARALVTQEHDGERDHGPSEHHCARDEDLQGLQRGRGRLAKEDAWNRRHETGHLDGGGKERRNKLECRLCSTAFRNSIGPLIVYPAWAMMDK